jgi:hypothetical protein
VDAGPATFEVFLAARRLAAWLGVADRADRIDRTE